ncbi:hypothetical protein SAMN05414139_10249 [Burkholderia sp. D7]|nr:hypothetical protein SAMN05414139_10249 [Burkholderia sp. D7]
MAKIQAAFEEWLFFLDEMEQHAPFVVGVFQLVFRYASSGVPAVAAMTMPADAQKFG